MRQVRLVDAPEFKRIQNEGSEETVHVYKSAIAEVEKVGREGEDVYRWVISDATVDRDNDTINPKGWDLKSYRKNPVVQFAHSYGTPPIGKSLRVWQEDGKLRSLMRFTDEDENPFGAMIGRLVDGKFLRAASVGFIPKVWEFNEERADPDSFRRAIDFMKQELLEWSVVPIPSNPAALQGASAAGIDLGPMKGWLEQMLDEGEESGIVIPRSTLEGLFNTVSTNNLTIQLADLEIENDQALSAKHLESVEPTSPQNRAIGYSDAHREGTRKAPIETPWARELDLERQAFAFADGAELCFPHHRGDGTLVYRGVLEAARDMARSGLSSEDQAEVMAHLERHLDEFDVRAPWASEPEAWEGYATLCGQRVAEFEEGVDEIPIGLRTAIRGLELVLFPVLSEQSRSIEFDEERELWIAREGETERFAFTDEFIRGVGESWRLGREFGLEFTLRGPATQVSETRVPPAEEVELEDEDDLEQVVADALEGEDLPGLIRGSIRDEVMASFGRLD